MTIKTREALLMVFTVIIGIFLLSAYQILDKIKSKLKSVKNKATECFIGAKL